MEVDVKMRVVTTQRGGIVVLLAVEVDVKMRVVTTGVVEESAAYGVEVDGEMRVVSNDFRAVFFLTQIPQMPQIFMLCGIFLKIISQKSCEI